MRQDELLIGAHISSAGGAYRAVLEGARISCTVVQIFTSNQKQWKGRVISEDELTLWFDALEKTGITHVMSHDSYLINLASKDELLLEKSKKAFLEEIERCRLLQIPYLNFHPGVATSGTEMDALDQIVKSLLSFEDVLEKGSTRLLLETTAGQGRSVGHRFEHLAYIIEKTKKCIPIGVCIDTCHIFSAGYDIRTSDAWERTMKEFDQVIGLDHLHAFHLNDSMKEYAARKDRHASLGKGTMGLEAFHFLVNHPKTKHLPMYLETPNKDIYQDELNLLRNLVGKTLEIYRK